MAEFPQMPQLSLEEILRQMRRSQFDPLTEALNIGRTLPVGIGQIRAEQARRPQYQQFLETGDGLAPRSLEETKTMADILEARAKPGQAKAALEAAQARLESAREE